MSERAAQEAGELQRIRHIKERLGASLIVLAHHYQRQSIVELSDLRGDSYELSAAAAANEEARHIVFCGVRFMAEAAAILARPGQVVVHPEPDAGCPMADMADEVQVERALDDLATHHGIDLAALVPVVYMNSDAELKAICGREGGLVCTSSNAPRAFRWAFERGERVFFFPDEHLGRNSARALGIPPGEVALYDPARPRGGLSRDEVARARVLIWKGYCHVHTHFVPEQIEEARARYPGARVVVHPECPVEVVERADASGSTRRIVDEAEAAPPGSTLVVGTEIHLVERLAGEHPDKQIVPLSRSHCPNMSKVTLPKFLRALETLEEPERVVVVEERVRRDARLALERMLEV